MSHGVYRATRLTRKAIHQNSFLHQNGYVLGERAKFICELRFPISLFFCQSRMRVGVGIAEVAALQHTAAT